MRTSSCRCCCCRCPAAERHKRVEIALDAVNLRDRANHYPRQLSGGQEQRVGIARAIVANPTIIVGDEPTGDLDAETTEQILDLIQRLNTELGMTLLLVTHDPRVAALAAAAAAAGKGQADREGTRSGGRGRRIPGTEGLTMFKFAPYVFKSLWRHRSRTMLTVSGSAVALFVFCFVGAVQQGLARLTEDQQAQRTLIVFQENRFCPASSKLPEDYARTVAKMPGVKDVVPIKVFTNNCRASLDVVVFNGMPPEKLRSARELTLLSGDWSRVR